LAPTDEFDFDYFQHGDYVKAVERKNDSENISKVLYPNDNQHLGKKLRLKQEYFFVSATLQDIFADWKKDNDSFTDLPEKIAVANDMHPPCAHREMLHGNLFRQVGETVVVLFPVGKDILQGGGDKEVFLLQPQLLA